MKNPKIKKIEIKTTCEQVVEYATMCRLGQIRKSFNDHIASIHGKDKGTVIADLQGVDRQRPKLHNADLRGIDLQEAELLYGVDLHGANLQKANLQSANLQKTNMQGANLIGANLRDADLRNVDLRGADLKGANLKGINLEGADLGGVDLRGINLEGANLEGAKLQGANLQGIDLQGVNLEGAKLQGANLQGAKLDGANLQRANLKGANLQDVIVLQKVNLQEANLRGADLRKARLVRANLAGANLAEANLKQAELSCAELQGANLRGANLYLAELLMTNLQGADLTNTILIGAEDLPTSPNIRMSSILFAHINIKNPPPLSEEHYKQAIFTDEQLDTAVDRLIIDPSLSLLDYHMSGMYDAAKPETKAKLEAAFPRLQWDKPLEVVQLQAAQLLTMLMVHNGLDRLWPNATTMKDAAGSQETSNILPDEIAMETLKSSPEYRGVKTMLNQEQFDAVWSFFLNYKPGEGLSEQDCARYLLAENGTPKLRVEANKEKAAMSFKEKFMKEDSNLKNEGPRNWVEKASHTRQAEWQSGR